MRSRVDLPAPERPMTPTNDPASTLSDHIVDSGFLAKAAAEVFDHQHAASVDQFLTTSVAMSAQRFRDTC